MSRGSRTRCWRWCSRSARGPCRFCSGSGPSRRSKDDGRCRAARSPPMSGWARRSDGIWRPRWTSPASRTWNSWRPAAIPRAIPGAACWARPTWPSCPATPSRASPRTRPGTRSRRFRRRRSTTARSPNPGGSGSGQAVLHQHRLRPGPGNLHHRPAQGHLRRLGRPPDLGDQPAANPDPPRRHRGHARGGPADVGGRQAGHALPFRDPEADRHQPFCRFPPPGAVDGGAVKSPAPRPPAVARPRLRARGRSGRRAVRRAVTQAAPRQAPARAV